MTASSQIIEVINALCARLGIAIDWTVENALIVFEGLAAKFAAVEIGTSWAWIGIVLSLLMLAACLVAVAKKTYDPACDDGFFLCLAIGVFAVVLLGCICVIPVQVLDIIEATAFPEKIVFDYVQTMLQSS